MKRIIACAAAILLVVVSPAFAQDGCQPLDSIIKDLENLGAKRSDIIALPDIALTHKYIEKLPIAVPETSNPVALLFVKTPNAMIVGLVEPEGCVRYTAVVPHEAHNRAMSRILIDA
jgi:hypothetical protein